MEDRSNEFGELLLEHYLQYQMKERREITQKEFAEYIGIDDKLYNHIYKGRRKPSKVMVKILAEFFNDMRFFDAAGLTRPDPEIHYLQSNWRNLPKKRRREILEEIGEYSSDDKKQI